MQPPSLVCPSFLLLLTHFTALNASSFPSFFQASSTFHFTVWVEGTQLSPIVLLLSIFSHLHNTNTLPLFVARHVQVCVSVCVCVRAAASSKDQDSHLLPLQDNICIHPTITLGEEPFTPALSHQRATFSWSAALDISWRTAIISLRQVTSPLSPTSPFYISLLIMTLRWDIQWPISNCLSLKLAHQTPQASLILFQALSPSLFCSPQPFQHVIVYNVGRWSRKHRLGVSV